MPAEVGSNGGVSGLIDEGLGTYYNAEILYWSLDSSSQVDEVGGYGDSGNQNYVSGIKRYFGVCVGRVNAAPDSPPKIPQVGDLEAEIRLQTDYGKVYTGTALVRNIRLGRRYPGGAYSIIFNFVVQGALTEDWV